MKPVSYQYHNDLILTGAVSCVLVSGNLKIEIGVNHGCVPISIDKQITRAIENTVYEIDNKRAWSFFQEYLGAEEKELTFENSPSISIGVELPDEISTEYDKYIIRAPICDNSDGSVGFLTELSNGEKIRIMRRDEEKISEGAKKLAERIKTKLDGKKPIAVFQFDCAGRGKMYFGEHVKEKGIDVIQDILGKDIPWLGFYCFGEIAPIKNSNFYHNLTVSLCVIYE
jgi:hypothetical protein